MEIDSKKKGGYSKNTIVRARELYFLDYRVEDIRAQLNINNIGVIYYWIDKYEWNKDKPPMAALAATTKRFNALLDVDDKTGSQLQEVEILASILLKFRDQEIQSAERAAKATNKAQYLDNEGIAKNSREAKRNNKKHKKNDVSNINEADFKKFIEANLYEHQLISYYASKQPETARNRFILKPRQAGGSFGVAAEAFERAVLKGHNQIFISATKAQAEVFKSYIAVIAMKFFEVEISGNPSRLTKDGVPWAELHYISPNSNAQSRAGDVVFDEVFWTPNWKKMEQLAKPMATQAQYGRTYISTPSTVSHEAYGYWNGDWFNDNRKKSERVEIDVDDLSLLKKGRLDPDGFWRFAYTVHDAVEWGFDLVDIEQLRLETDPAMFPCIFECQFIDDRSSVFKLKEILACAVDAGSWLGFDKDSARPFGDNPVSGGYDPAGVGDNSSFVLLSKPLNSADKFRQLVSVNWRGMPVTQQVENIKDYMDRYRLENLFIDATGPGIFVGDYVEDFFPTLQKIQYSPEEKGRMVQKAQSVISSKRFEYDQNNKDLPLAFMTVQQTVTGTGQITYISTRSKRVGHGDEAWATMQAMMCEPLNISKTRKTKIRVYN